MHLSPNNKSNMYNQGRNLRKTFLLVYEYIKLSI